MFGVMLGIGSARRGAGRKLVVLLVKIIDFFGKGVRDDIWGMRWMKLMALNHHLGSQFCFFLFLFWGVERKRTYLTFFPHAPSIAYLVWNSSRYVYRGGHKY